jgi:amidase
MVDRYSSAAVFAAAIRSRRTSARELLDLHLERIAKHNPALNAICTLDEPGARASAREADAALARGELRGPLHGVPMTIKDALETAGVRTTGGHPPLKDYVPQRDAPAVARLRAAGAILLGKTNVPPLSADYRADNPIFGRTNNPWDLARTPGGSTGGVVGVRCGQRPRRLGENAGAFLRPVLPQADGAARAEHRSHSGAARPAARGAPHERLRAAGSLDRGFVSYSENHFGPRRRGIGRAAGAVGRSARAAARRYALCLELQFRRRSGDPRHEECHCEACERARAPGLQGRGAQSCGFRLRGGLGHLGRDRNRSTRASAMACRWRAARRRALAPASPITWRR